MGARGAARPLRGAELAAVAAAVAAAYGGVLYGLHCRVGREASEPRGQPADAAEEVPVAAAGPAENYWGTLPSAWDHPEPNYLISPAVGEFWSVVTTIPIAGSLLAYEGMKYRYPWKVLRIYAVTCTMYTLAFSAHLTLQKFVFSATVTSVMSNALLTFAEFSSVVHWTLRSPWIRGAIVLVAEVMLVSTVATLPYALSANGGVWTLFVVQSPGVFLATGIAGAMAIRSQRKEEQTTYRIVCQAGALLSSAMVLSFIECLIGFEHGILRDWWGFPWLHIIIHVFEQVGIYIFGVGVAALHELLLKPRVGGAEVRYVAYMVPYLYCPLSAGGAGADAAALAPATGGAEAPLAPASGEPKGGEARGRSREAKRPAATAAPQKAGAGGAVPVGAEVAEKAPLPTLQKRRRDQTPGAPCKAVPVE